MTRRPTPENSRGARAERRAWLTQARRVKASCLSEGMQDFVERHFIAFGLQRQKRRATGEHK